MPFSQRNTDINGSDCHYTYNVPVHLCQWAAKLLSQHLVSNYARRYWIKCFLFRLYLWSEVFVFVAELIVPMVFLFWLLITIGSDCVNLTFPSIIPLFKTSKYRKWNRQPVMNSGLYPSVLTNFSPPSTMQSLCFTLVFTDFGRQCYVTSLSHSQGLILAKKYYFDKWLTKALNIVCDGTISFGAIV